MIDVHVSRDRPCGRWRHWSTDLGKMAIQGTKGVSFCKVALARLPQVMPHTAWPELCLRWTSANARHIWQALGQFLACIPSYLTKRITSAFPLRNQIHPKLLPTNAPPLRIYFGSACLSESFFLSVRKSSTGSVCHNADRHSANPLPSGEYRSARQGSLANQPGIPHDFSPTEIACDKTAHGPRTRAPL